MTSRVLGSLVIEEESTARTADISMGELKECQGLGAGVRVFVCESAVLCVVFFLCLSPSVCLVEPHVPTLVCT